MRNSICRIATADRSNAHFRLQGDFDLSDAQQLFELLAEDAESAAFTIDLSQTLSIDAGILGTRLCVWPVSGVKQRLRRFVSATQAVTLAICSPFANSTDRWIWAAAPSPSKGDPATYRTQAVCAS